MITQPSIYRLRRSVRPGIHPGLKTIQRLLRALDNPHLNYRRILVAGTNGKGSTSNYLCSFCIGLGIATGLFTSPHLISFNERFRVQDREIRDEELVHYMERLDQVAQEQGLHPTFFEFATAIAHCFFNHQNIDLAVLEVGLGGRLDATHVAPSHLVLLTDISYDHMDFLGDSLSEITQEKAAIIPRRGHVVCSSQEKEAMRIIQKEAYKKEATLHVLDQDFFLKKNPDSTYSFQHGDFSLDGLSLTHPGEHQRRNLALALCAISFLRKWGWFHLKEDFMPFNQKIRSRLKSIRLPGRFQILNPQIFKPEPFDSILNPVFLVDGAHNPKAFACLLDTLLCEKKVLPGQIHFILAIKCDKNWREMLDLIPENIGSVTFTEVSALTDGGRGNFVPSGQLYRYMVMRRSIDSECLFQEPSPEKALNRVFHWTQDRYGQGRPWIVVTGSLYLVGQILSYYKKWYLP